MQPKKVNDLEIPVLYYLSDYCFISGKELSNSLGMSRVAVWKQIQKLKKLGYQIIASGKDGYKITSRPDILLAAEVSKMIKTKDIAKKIFYYKKVDSTNSLAKQLLKNENNNLPEGTVLIAGEQTAGRGRLGRNWYSPKGGVWFTIILFPDLEPAYISRITLMSAVVLVNSLKTLYNLKPKIKWPNDIIFEGQKIAGILTEMSAEADKINYILIGIGINANLQTDWFPSEIRKQSISLAEILQKPVSKVQLLRLILENFEKYYSILKKRQFSLILEEWKQNTETLGKYVTIMSGEKTTSGKVIDIKLDGSLIIKEDNGNLQNILSGTLL